MVELLQYSESGFHHELVQFRLDPPKVTPATPVFWVTAERKSPDERRIPVSNFTVEPPITTPASSAEAVDKIKVMKRKPTARNRQISSTYISKKLLHKFVLKGDVTYKDLVAVLWAVSASGGDFDLLGRNAWWFARAVALMVLAVDKGVGAPTAENAEYRKLVKETFPLIPLLLIVDKSNEKSRRSRSK